MIVVVGSVAFRPGAGRDGRAVGGAAEIAAAAAASGSQVELLAKIGEDGTGEELLLALARAGIGHLAMLREPALPTGLAPDLVTEDDEVPPDGELVEAVVAEPVLDEGTAAPGPGLALEPADLTLGLHYLREYGVVVAVEPLAEGCAPVVADAAAFAGASLVVVAPPGAPLPDAYARATVLEAPAADPDGVFAALVGRLAAALDRGTPAAEALGAAVAAGGWEPAEA